MQGNCNIDDTSVIMNNMMNVKNSVVQVGTTYTHMQPYILTHMHTQTPTCTHTHTHTLAHYTHTGTNFTHTHRHTCSAPSRIYKDFNDAQAHVKANALSQQTGGLPMKLQITSLMHEDRTGYQLVTVKLSDADKPTDQGKFENQPVGTPSSYHFAPHPTTILPSHIHTQDIMMEKIPCADGGLPLYIR